MKIIKKLGEGSFGKVYLVQDEITGKKYVLKQVKMSTERIAASIDREQKILEKIKPICTPYLLCMKSFKISGDKAVFLFKYVRKIYELYDLITKSSFIRQSTHPMNFIIMEKLLLGLSQLHSVDVVHRDIKPANILINPNKLVAIYIDFGLACTRDDNKCLSKFCGTPNYMAPEIIKKEGGFEAVKASDIWALGITFLNMCFNTTIIKLLGKDDIHDEKTFYKVIKRLPQYNLDLVLDKLERAEFKPYVQLIRPMLRVNWHERITAEDALKLLYSMSNKFVHDIEGLFPQDYVQIIGKKALEDAKSFKVKNIPMLSVDSKEDSAVCLN